MFCAQCGTKLAAETTVCTSCGFGARESTSAPALGSEIQRQLAASSKDAASALLLLSGNPVGGLPAAYSGLGALRARSAGIALCTFFSLTAAIGLRVAAGHWLGGMLQFTDFAGLGAFLKLLLLLLIPPVALAAAAFGVRRVLGNQAEVAGDIFIAGASLAPTGIALLLGGFLGAGNLEVVSLLFLFAFCYLILMLYSGLTAIGGVSARAAAPAVPVIASLAIWLTKIVFVAVF
jgi:hypothetical protein